MARTASRRAQVQHGHATAREYYAARDNYCPVSFEHFHDSSQWRALVKAVMKRRGLRNERYCSVFQSETLTRPDFIFEASVRHLGEGTPGRPEVLPAVTVTLDTL